MGEYPCAARDLSLLDFRLARFEIDADYLGNNRSMNLLKRIRRFA